MAPSARDHGVSRPPSFDEIFAVMSKASVGDASARVVVPDDAPPDDLATRFAVALNLLLDDLTFRADEARAADRMRLAVEALRDIASLTGRALDAEGLARFVVDRTRTVFGMDVASLYWWNAERDALELVAESGGPESVPVPSLARGQGASGRALETGAPVVIPDYASYDRPAVPGVTGSAVAVPLVLRDAPVGTLYVRSAAVRDIPDELVRMLALFGAQVAPILEVSRLQAELRKEQERSAMALELRRLNIELETANRELESFSYSVAHDLRAPLRSMDGFSAALLRDYEGKLDAAGQKYLRYVRESAQDMGRLIDDLLKLSRVTRAELRRERVDLSGAARAIAERLRQGSDRHVEIVISDGLVAEGDARLLSIALDDLIGNAWKFTRRREVARIEVGLRNGEGPPTFFVRDNGAGFDMAYAGKLFGVFQRLHPMDEFEGTGIGLATVQRIVRRHGGQVWAEGDVGRGATFYFTLETGPG
jgi:signal transduction histidine kinase